MTPTIRTITAALAALAIAAPAATAMPADGPTGASDTTSAPRDFARTAARNADAEAPIAQPPTWPVDPEPIARTQPSAASVDGDGGNSPLVFVVPALVGLILAAGVGYAVHASVRTRRAHA